VTTVYRERGFGFIQDIDTGISRFVHRSGFRAENEVDSVRPGAVVNYIPVQGPRGPVAVDVLSEPGPAVPGLEPRVGPEQQVQRAEAEASTDLDGWLRLMQSYMVLGERDKAVAAAGDARRAFASEPDKLRRIEEFAKGLGLRG
jgi:cold shock CspA family protein